MLDAYWTIFRTNPTTVWVWDEIKDKQMARHCKSFKTEQEALDYMEAFIKEWTPKVAKLDRISD